MSFALQVSATQYAGNNSTATAYPIAFPIVSMDHVAVTVQSPAGATPLVLGPGQFSVHDRGAGLYDVTTAAAWPATALVTVFRSIPFDQPFEFPEGSLFRTSEIERAFDRVVMQMHQLWRLYTGGAGGTILPGAGTTVRSLAVWSDAAAQSSVMPAYHGQIGTRLSDDTLWIAQSTSAGDWQAYVVPQGLDVWEVDPFELPPIDDGVPHFERALGMIPNAFFVTHVRLSTPYNSGVTLHWGIKTGEGFNVGPQFATGSWIWSAGGYTVLIPFANLNSPSTTQILPAGKTLLIDTFSERSYGAYTSPIRIAFLGRWLP